jgi:hypothetical protein
MRYGVAAALAVCALGATADTPFLTLHRSGVPTDYAGPAGLPIADLTGDGVADIVACAAGSPVVLSKKGADYAPVWYGRNVDCTAIALGDREGDGKPELFVGTNAQTSTRAKIYVFNPAGSVNPLGSVTLPTGALERINSIATGDVDSDGHAEVVAVTSSSAFIYGATSLLLEWDASGHGGTQVRIANIDDDGRTEIVINGTTGRVLDAYAQSLKWGYAGGFGKFQVGNVDSDPEHEIVSITETNVRILNGDDFSSTSFTTPDDFYGGAFALGDLSGDGKPEIIREVGTLIAGYDTAGTQLWSFNNHPEGGSAAMAVGDVDGDGAQELIVTSGLNHSGADKLRIANKTGVEYTVTDLDGYFSTAVADLDGDGNLELIVGAYSTGSSYSGGVVQVLDYRTKAVKATLAPKSQYGWVLNVWQIEVGQLDNDPALEILIVGGAPYDGELHVFDGVTWAEQWSSAPYDPTYLARTAVVANIDSDPVDEIIAGLDDNSIYVLNGASLIIQWTSPSLGATLYDIEVADVDQDGKKDLVVGTHDAVHIFTPATNAARKVTLANSAIRVAATAGRFAVLEGDQWGGQGNHTTNVRSFKGSDLSQEFACPFTTTSQYYRGRAIALGPVGGEDRLLVAQDGSVFVVPLGGTSCPAMDSIFLGAADMIYGMHFAELTGDAHPELLVDLTYSWEILTVGNAGQPRGDVDRDGVVTDVDIDTLVRWLLADGPGIPPAADVNGDGCIDASDVFYLINYRRSTGAAPVP